MKIRNTGLVLLAAMILSAGYQYGRAESKPDKPTSKMGIVSIRKIFENCERNKKYKQEATAEQEKLSAELEKLSKEVDADRAGLKTLKEGSDDRMNLIKEILTKQANLEAQKDFYKQMLETKDQKWTERLYVDVLAKTKEVAEQKGLDIVFEEDEVDLSGVTPNELMLTIRTHKVLYAGNCVDITDEVIAKVDTMEKDKEKEKTKGK